MNRYGEKWQPPTLIQRSSLRNRRFLSLAIFILTIFKRFVFEVSVFGDRLRGKGTDPFSGYS